MPNRVGWSDAMHATPQSLRRCLACDAQSARTFSVDISEAQNIIHRDRVVVGVDGRHECQR